MLTRRKCNRRIKHQQFTQISLHGLLVKVDGTGCNDMLMCQVDASDEVHEIVQTFSVDLRLIVPQGDQDDGEVDDAEHMPLVRTQFASSLGADVGRNGIDPGGKLGIT